MATRKRRPLISEGLLSVEEPNMETEQTENHSQIEEDSLIVDTNPVEAVTEENQIEPQIPEESIAVLEKNVKVTESNRPRFYPKKSKNNVKQRNTPRFS